MKKLMLLTLLALAVPAFGDPIQGTIALAGADTYTTNGIHFNGPGIVILGSGNFAALVGTTFPIFPPSEQINFKSAVGDVLSIGGISMDLLSLNVVNNNANFLNIIGTANMSETGFNTTLYDYTLTATRPDGISSYTLTAAPPAPVAEIGTLFLVGTALVIFALGGFARKRYIGGKALKGYPLNVTLLEG